MTHHLVLFDDIQRKVLPWHKDLCSMTPDLMQASYIPTPENFNISRHKLNSLLLLVPYILEGQAYLRGCSVLRAGHSLLWM